MQKTTSTQAPLRILNDTRKDWLVNSSGHSCEKTIIPNIQSCTACFWKFRFRKLQNIFSKGSNRNILLFNLKTSININWDDNTPISACVHVKSVIRDGDVEIHSRMSFKNTQKLDMLYTSLLKCICIIFTNQNTHNIFYYKTLGNVTFEICNLKGHTCVHYQYETPEELH